MKSIDRVTISALFMYFIVRTNDTVSWRILFFHVIGTYWWKRLPRRWKGFCDANLPICGLIPSFRCFSTKVSTYFPLDSRTRPPNFLWRTWEQKIHKFIRCLDSFCTTFSVFYIQQDMLMPLIYWLY